MNRKPISTPLPDDIQEQMTRAAMRRKFRNLAWYACCFFVFISVFMLVNVYQKRSQMVGDGTDPVTYLFDLSNFHGTQKLLVGSLSPRDGMRVLDNPTLVTKDTLKLLHDPGPRIADTGALDAVNDGPGGAFKRIIVHNDVVIGITINGQSRAYPLRVMRWHEVVNDTVGGEPIALTYSTLCDSAVAFSRRIKGQTAEFGFSGLLYDSNTLLYDREPNHKGESLWLQLTGECISGPKQGESLKILPVSYTTWGEWRKAHPDTTLLVGESSMRGDYSRDYLAEKRYFEKGKLWFPVEPVPAAGSKLKLMDPVNARLVDGKWIVTPGEDMLLKAGEKTPTIHARWFAWYAIRGDGGRN